MQKRTTLFFLLFSLTCFGQKAITGSIIIQPKAQVYEFSQNSGALRFEAEVRTSQIPSFAVSYFDFKDGEHFNRWNASGWHYNHFENSVIISEDSTGLVEPVSGYDIKTAGGKVGFSKGRAIKSKNKKLRLFIEAASSLQWQYVGVLPKTSQGYPRNSYAANIQFGPNLMLQRQFKQGFMHFGLLAPIFQLEFQINEFQNPSWAKGQQQTSIIGFDVEVWRRTGLEIGGGFFIGN